MVKTIYVDVLFLINFIINYLILFSASHIGSARKRRFYIMLGALIGAFYGVAVFFKELSFLTSFIFKAGVATLMTGVSFGFRDAKKLLRMTLIFFLISLAFGGTVLFAYLLGAGGICEVRNNTYYIHIPLSTLLLTSGAAYILLSIVFYRKSGAKKQEFCEISVEHDGKRTDFTALYDTGNTLCDPLTNAPVIICDYKAARDILPESARLVLDTKNPDTFPSAIAELPESLKFRLVPYKTVGSAFSTLLAFKPQNVTVDKKKDRDIILALSPEKISDGGAYSALI